MDENDELELMDAARVAMERAYCPYSRYRVGAAVRDEHGRLHVGCNVENAAYPLGSCAEANAIAAMVVAGGTRIAAIAVVAESLQTGPAVTRPCGGCRQRIAEFATAVTTVLLQEGDGSVTRHRSAALLPQAFEL